LTPFDSLQTLQKAIIARQTSCVKVVEYFLENIRKNTELNVFLEVYTDEALLEARRIDQKFSQGTQGKLAGLVVGLKDVLCYQNHSLQASSKILDGFKSQFTATAVQRLLDEDAIIIGRQNCDEFAMGSSNENSGFGAVCNAIDNTRVSGGSSGGSAVAVQADMCHISLGSDTGGSVRQPASFCGVIGLKPSYGRISRYGLIAYASSFDCIGILGKNIPDIAKVLEITAGTDDFDSTVSHSEVEAYSEKLTYNQKAKIAFLKEAIDNEGISPESKHFTLTKIEALRKAGHTVEAVDFPYLKYLLPTYYVLTTAEASSNLSRYDGVRYGYRSPSVQDLESLYTRSRSEGFGVEVKRRIMLGTFVLSAGYYDAYYTKAQQVRRLIKQWTDKLFKEYDFIVSPTTPDVAFKIGEKRENILQMFWEDVFTVQANLVGIPAISIPNGQNEQGLPLGFQIMSASFSEADLLAFAQSLL
jgi:aspartyl-tRNA(Asn)/glutamyl-tRNA(Gln) amidotransferase subunit A